MARPSRTGDKISEVKARKASAAKGRKTTKTKRRITPAATRAKRGPASGPSKDLKEAREQQAATAEILKVIASSPSDAQPVFEAIAASANQLIGGFSSAVFRFVDGIQHLAAFTSTNTASDQALKASFPRPMRETPIYEPIGRGAAVQIVDTEAADELSKELGRARGFRSVSFTPLISHETVIGMIAVTRKEPGPFAAPHVQLLQTFADQAVIAIENARLFNETLEALERQTATSQVLQVISSSPGELKPVFESMLANAMRICEAQCGFIYQMEAGAMRAMAEIGVPPALAEYRRNHLHTGGTTTPVDLMRATRKPAHVHDARDSEAYRMGNPNAVAGVELGGARTVLYVPMIKDDEIVGVINLYRQEVRPFSDDQIALLENFASQAVIAIENTRLLKALRQRTDDLSESLQQQTATGDVLKIISRSSIDLRTVLDTLVETVARLCRADQAVVFRRRDDLYHLAAAHGFSSEAREFTLAHPLPLDRGTLSGRVEMERRAVHIHDVMEDPEYSWEGQKVVGFRTMLGIPLLREESLIGIFSINRTRVEPFTDKEIELATSFADQAVIAIENARLFDELRDRQAELSVTFDNMGDGVAMFDSGLRLTAWNHNFQEILDLPDAFVAQRPSYNEYFRYLAERGEYSTDLEAELGRAMQDISREMRFERARPDGRVVEVRRNPVPDGGFVLIYSDITERKRAEEAIRAARDSAETALLELRTAQDRLVQTEKLASLGQLTAGIAHEIKNPLNFVNNFSALSAELVDEMNDVLADTTLEDKKREELDEIRELLKSNLEKVVQHGKRADSIVKNMLLHSRSGSGEHRPVEVNAIIDESLNLAYHGARAEKQGFNITLERDFDPTTGVADVYPQEVTRALLNLISNGFYAATKRASEAGDGFEPKLKAITRNLGDKVEIRIRDNGTGIPPEIKEKIFNPFFTTKPAGEGTGLGLSMSHDIIVKQHGGTIDVETEPGAFTEFRIVLRRAGALQLVQ